MREIVCATPGRRAPMWRWRRWSPAFLSCWPTPMSEMNRRQSQRREELMLPVGILTRRGLGELVAERCGG